MFHSYLVSYDLVSPGQEYSALYKELEKLGIRIKPLESVWLVKSLKSAGRLRDYLVSSAALDSNDKLFIVEIGPGWATVGIPSSVTDWLKQNL